jgi:hypothetical protein
MKKTLILIAMVAMATQIKAADGGEQFLQLSLTPDIALHSKDTTIKGISLNIWGENPQHSFTLGIVNGSTGESSGFSWAFAANYAESYTGVQWAFVNISKTSFKGWQSGAVNYSTGTFTGLQTGFLNYAENLHGVQLGFANIAMNNGWFDEFPNKLAKGFPFLNWSF